MTNSVCVNFSLSMIRSLKKVAAREGLSLEEFVSELAKEGIYRRLIEERNKENVNSFMTRNGYIDKNKRNFK